MIIILLKQQDYLQQEGVGNLPTEGDLIRLIECFGIIDSWMKSLLGEFK